MARVLFVDDHPLYRSGVRAALERALPELDVLLAASGAEALALLATDADIDLCLADLRLPGEDGFALLETLREDWPGVARGVLCADLTAETARRARALGCVACLSKARDVDALSEAIGALFDGLVVFDAEPDEGQGLSERRRKVLELAARGLSNKEIALELGIAERTVKGHWASIFEQLEAANRAEAVSRAHQLGLI